MNGGMPLFSITLEPTFRKRLRNKTRAQQAAILKCIQLLARNPHSPGLRTKRIRGKGTWEARADLSNRVEWEYGQASEIVLINHCSHKDVYG